MEKNYKERLEALRELTELSPWESWKLYRLRKRAEKAERFYKEYYEQSAGLSYSDDIEYVMRERKLESDMTEPWNEYMEIEHDEVSLKEFTGNALDAYIADKEKVRVRK